MKDKELQDRLTKYEQTILDYENEKKALCETMKQKDNDILFIKGQYEEANAMWHRENQEKQKLEAVIEQQHREAMELEALRRKVEEERNFHRCKTRNAQQEVEEYVRENRRLMQEKAALSARLNNLR